MLEKAEEETVLREETRDNDLEHGAEDRQDDITNVQINQLLRRAELRLQNQINDSPKSDARLHSSRSCTSYRCPMLEVGRIARPYVVSSHGIARADATSFIHKNDRRLLEKSRRVEEPIEAKKKIIQARKANAGSNWFNLPRTTMNPALKRDLQLLKMRSVLDPKRHYKKENSQAKAPDFSQVGTLIEGPTEYFSSRLHNKDRKKTFVDEVLAAEDFTGRFNRKYIDIQARTTSGRKAFYRNLKTKRSGQSIR